MSATGHADVSAQIEDLKQYFEYSDDDDLENMVPSAMADEVDLILNTGRPSLMNKEQLLRRLPEKGVMNQIIMRYFSSASPSQRRLFRCSGYVVCLYMADSMSSDAFHRPTFSETVR